MAKTGSSPRKVKISFKEAVVIHQNCDPIDCDCEECPIGTPMELVAHDGGVKIVASVCSMIQALDDVCESPREYKYKRG